MTTTADAPLQFHPYLKIGDHFSQWLDKINNPTTDTERFFKSIRDDDEQGFHDVLPKIDPMDGRFHMNIYEFTRTAESDEVLMRMDAQSLAFGERRAAPLMMAVMFGRQNFVEVLAPLSESIGIEDSAALAANIGNAGALKILIEQNQTNDYYSIAKAAVRNGHAKCLELIVDKLDKSELEKQMRIVWITGRKPMVEAIFQAHALRMKHIGSAASSAARQGL